jgi:hypothetical protein
MNYLYRFSTSVPSHQTNKNNFGPHFSLIFLILIIFVIFTKRLYLKILYLDKIRMGNYQDISISKLVKEINEKYFLPEIQREFVWDKDKSKFEDKLYDLFDSIMRGYPIGTFLFWDVKHKNLIEDNITVLKFLDNSNSENESVDRDNFKERRLILC